MKHSPLRGWLIAGGVVAIAAASTWAAGGFEPAETRDTVAVGEWIELTRWDVRVDGCSVLPPPMEGWPPQAELRLTVVNRWNQSQPAIDNNSWRVELPNGDSYGSGGPYLALLDTERSGWFDPDVERSAVSRMDLESGTWGEDEMVRVKFATERPSDTLVTIGGWDADHLAATLSVPCPAQGQQ